jgi:glycosyltransferase involved in cell wall biosynthesis
MDNQFHNSLKQSLFLRSMFGPYFVRNLFQYAFVAGPRQKNYAEMIGFTEDRIESGVYAYDDRVFFPKTLDSRLNQFCFVGRKVPVKGLNVLLKANNIYRGMCAENDIEPWNLIIAGPGSITGEFSIGVQELGYLNPREVAQLLASSKCFVLPSEFEPFGVVLTEAAACGCLLIASDAVGAADSLIESNVNGYIFAKNSHADLARALLKITQFTSIQENQGQTDSIARAQNFATSVWSEKVLNIFSEHKKLKP